MADRASARPPADCRPRSHGGPDSSASKRKLSPKNHRIPPDPSGQDWSDREIDLIVADYFGMLALEVAGRPYVKAQRNAQLY
ncbi:MAG: hypothetical protein FJX68_18460 [Alphaproteobacteria bacterium]|nr:hypothetical protein [Alphaproteobacteria bacterium]